MEMDQKLCETAFTGQKLEKLLLRSLEKGQNGHSVPLNGLRLLSVDARPVGIQGYLSKVLQIRLTWNQKCASAPDSVIVKCPTSEKLQVMLDKAFESVTDQVPDASLSIREFHNDECLVYEILYNGDDGNRLTDIPIPRIFAAETIGEGRPCSEGVLIMEDMSKMGSVMQNIGAKMNRRQIETLTDALANLHAWSYIQWKNGGNDHIPAVQDRTERWKTIYCSTTPEIIQLMKTEFPEIFSDLPEKKMLDLLSPEAFVEIFGVSAANDEKCPVVLVHGDVQPMNILYSTEENEPIRMVGLIDWQLAHKGYGMEDFARLFSICATGEFKRKHGDEILHRYVDAFNAKIEGTGLKPIQFENVKAVFVKMYAFMAMTFSSAIRIVNQLFEMIGDEKEREKQKTAYVEHCADLYRDATEILGW